MFACLKTEYKRKKRKVKITFFFSLLLNYANTLRVKKSWSQVRQHNFNNKKSVKLKTKIGEK